MRTRGVSLCRSTRTLNVFSTATRIAGAGPHRHVPAVSALSLARASTLAKPPFRWSVAGSIERVVVAFSWATFYVVMSPVIREYSTV